MKVTLMPNFTRENAYETSVKLCKALDTLEWLPADKEVIEKLKEHSNC